MKACQLKNDIYEPKKLEAVYQNLLAKSKTDKPQYYEIRVDDFAVVEKTSDPERFMTYAEFVDANTKHISVFLYHTNSTASDKWFFHLQPNQYTTATGLNGIGSHESPLEQEKTQKEKWRKDLHYEQLIEENEALKKELEEYQHTIELIEEEKETIKSHRDLNLEGIAGLLISAAGKSELIKKAFPFVGDLAGMNHVNQTPNPEEQTTFRRKASTTPDPEDVETEDVETVEITDEDKKHIEFMRAIKERVGDIELINVIHLLQIVTSSPQAIHFAIKQVTNYLKQKPNTTPANKTTANTNQSEEDF